VFVSNQNLAVSPASAGIPYDFPTPLHDNAIGRNQIQTSLHYQANLAVQRDIGFSTTVEVAYVGNFGRHYYRQKTTNNVPLNAYANVNNLFNGEAISANFIRQDFPGMGALNYATSDEVGLDYNSLQLSVQHRLTHGLQFGFAYTLAKGQGIRGWDNFTEQSYGDAGNRAVYYGPLVASDQGQERRHVAVLNYSYQIPTINKPILKYVLGGWEASGVSTFVTGDAINPSCSSNSSNKGIANNDPSLSGQNLNRCEFVAGMGLGSLTSGYDMTSGGTYSLVEDQLHFNVNAIQRPLPLNAAGQEVAFTALAPNLNGAVKGNVGQGGPAGIVPYAALRNPGWSNWDFTLGRRLPIKVGHGGNVRLQLQFYNLFNQVEFNAMYATQTFNTTNSTGGYGGGNNATSGGRVAGQYTGVQNPFNFGVTIRFDY